MNAPTIVIDDKVQQIAEHYARRIVDIVLEDFRITLNWSDDSIRQVESLLDRFHKDIAVSHPTPEEIYGYAKLFGSYVGEVYRRNHGAKWGIVDWDGEQLPGLRTDKNGRLFWPWARVNNRLNNGPEDNVWHYYQILVSDDVKQWA